MSIGKRTRQLRTAHGLNQDQMAEICDATKSAVSQWESDDTTPTLTNIIRLQDRLGFSMDWLISGIGANTGESEQTRRLAELYAALDARGKAAVFRVAESESAYMTGGDTKEQGAA